MNDIDVAAFAKAIARELVRELQAANVTLTLPETTYPAHIQVGTGVYNVGPLTVDLARHEATLHGKPLALKPREFALLSVLARHPDQAFTRSRLLALAWPSDHTDDIESERTVDVHIRRVRSRLGAESDLVRTIHGIGYKLAPTVDGAG